MATQEARDLLDSLMGGDRNALLPKGASLQTIGAGPMLLPGQKAKSCFDPDICPYYTAWGVNVYELFTNTKSDIGQNPRVTDDGARQEYLKLPPNEQDRLGFESALFHKLQDLVRQCDRTISRNKEKLKQEVAQKSSKMNIDENHVDEMAVEHYIRAKIALESLEEQFAEQIAQLKLSEHPDPSQIAATAKTLSILAPQLDQLEHQKRMLEQPVELTDKTVCEVSGNFMSSRDADERIAAHYAGKQYQGWKLVRDKYDDMRKQYGASGPRRAPTSFRGPPPPSYGGRGGGGRWERGPPQYGRGGGGGYRGGGGDRGGRWQRGGGGGGWRR